MSSQQPQPENNTETSTIIEAKSLFSNGDVKRAFGVLREAALRGNAMACFDAGFMMIQGIGCVSDQKGGLQLLEKGYKLVRDWKDDCWKGDGSVSELFEAQFVNFFCLFLDVCL